MKHNFLVLFAGCGALTAVGFAGSHAQTARAAVQCTPVIAQVPVAVVIAPDGSRSVATCVATPCIAVACCDPKCDPKQGHAARSVVLVSTGGNGQVTVCGSGNGVYSVGHGGGQSMVTSTAVGSGSNGACSAGPNPCSAGGSSCSAGPVSSSVGVGSASAVRSSCSAGVGSGSCNTTSVGAGGVGQAHAGNLTVIEPLRLTGQSLAGQLIVAHSPTLTAQGGAAAQSVDLGELVQGLRGSVGALVVQDPQRADSDDAPQGMAPDGGGTFEVFEAPDMPEVADVEDMDAPDMDDDIAPDVAWNADSWNEQVEEALERARAQVADADEATTQALEREQEEVARAQSGWASGDAQRAYKEAMEKAQVEWHAAMTQAQGDASAGQHAGLLARSRAQAEQAQAQQEHLKAEMHWMQDGQQKRAHAEAQARGSSRGQSGGDAALEERVEALEKIAKARGREVSGGGSLESRVAELERAMRGQGEGQSPVVRAPRAARVVEVPRGGVFTTPDGVKRLEFARPATPKSGMRLGTPRAAGTPGTPPTPGMPGMPGMGPVGPMPKVVVPKMHGGSMSGMSGMDADTRRDLERAMSDLRREADRLREEMSKLRSEIDRLPRDSAR